VWAGAPDGGVFSFPRKRVLSRIVLGRPFFKGHGMKLNEKLTELGDVLDAGQLSVSEANFVEDMIQISLDEGAFSESDRNKINDLWEYKCG
jgi:hypothetical protein